MTLFKIIFIFILLLLIYNNFKNIFNKINNTLIYNKIFKKKI
jgi:hypothetical protein